MSNSSTLSRRSRLWRILAVLLAFGLIAAACGNDDDDAAVDPEPDPDTTETTDDEEEAPDPTEVTPGGSIAVGLEAEQNNWLPSVGNFGNPGVMAARAVYDPIAARGEDGQIYPYLAESIEPNDALDEWTVTLRSGIQFHDGTDLTAEVMKSIFDDYLSAEEIGRAHV